MGEGSQVMPRSRSNQDHLGAPPHPPRVMPCPPRPIRQQHPLLGKDLAPFSVRETQTVLTSSGCSMRSHPQELSRDKCVAPKVRGHFQGGFLTLAGPSSDSNTRERKRKRRKQPRRREEGENVTVAVEAGSRKTPDCLKEHKNPSCGFQRSQIPVMKAEQGRK